MTIAEAWNYCQWFFEIVGMIVTLLALCCLATAGYEDLKPNRFPRDTHPSLFRDWHKPVKHR